MFKPSQRHLFWSRLSEDRQAENWNPTLHHIRRWILGVWKTEEAENNFFSTSQGKRNIVLISTHKMSLSVIIFEIRISALFVSSTVNCDAIAHIFLNDLTIFLKCANIQLFIPAQKNVTFYVINQTNNFSLLLCTLNIFRLLFHFLSFLRYLPNCKQLTFNFNCQYWCPTPMVLHHPCGWWRTSRLRPRTRSAMCRWRL